jgi:Cache domain
VQVAWSANAVDEQRFDLLRLLRQVPAISEVTRIDGTGREQVRVSRISANPPGGNADVSKEPKFTEAMAKTVYYGPIVFRRPERATPVPFMTLSLQGVRPDAGVTAAEVNLKILWDLVAHIQIGERGNAYVIDSEGRIIAHRDLSKIERDVSSLAQVRAARGGAAQALTALDIDGRQVLCVYAPVGRLGWFVVAELPVDEADALAR